MSKKIYLLDPLTGVKNETNFDNLAKITGLTKRRLHHIKCKKSIIQQLGMYIVDADITVKEKLILMGNFKDDLETWREIKVDENLNVKYYVSSLGRIKCKYKSGKERLKVQFTKKGRRRLFAKIGIKEKLVSSLVADAFLGERNEGQALYHKDGNVQNNRVENLEIASKSKIGKLTGWLARAIPVIKIDPVTLEEIDYYASAAEAARDNYVLRDAINKCISGKYKSSAGFFWKVDPEYLKV